MMDSDITENTRGKNRESVFPQKVISIVIRVRDAEKDLHRCLSNLQQQKLQKDDLLEIVVVDNESTDNSAAVAKSYGAKIVFLSAEDFSWGRALNRGIEATSGEIVIILSADAYPADSYWISEMLHPFEDPRVAAVYGRQIPRPDAPIDEIIRLSKAFCNQSLRYNSMPDAFSERGGAVPISNACAAIQKSVWRQLPYDEHILAGEEGIWTFRVFEMGLSVVYQASACVYHSHNDPIIRYAWRHWELIGKNCRLKGEPFGVWQLLYFIAAFTKRRIRNCFSKVNVAFTKRVTGLLRIPLETMSLALIFFLSGTCKKSRAFRHKFWLL